MGVCDPDVFADGELGHAVLERMSRIAIELLSR